MYVSTSIYHTVFNQSINHKFVFVLDVKCYVLESHTGMVASHTLARAKREHVVHDEVEKANRRPT